MRARAVHSRVPFFFLSLPIACICSGIEKDWKYKAELDKEARTPAVMRVRYCEGVRCEYESIEGAYIHTKKVYVSTAKTVRQHIRCHRLS